VPKQIHEAMTLLATLPIPQEWLIPGGAVGLLGLTVLMVFRGWLVPASQVARIEQERDEWKSLALQAMDQNQQLLAQGRTVVDVLNAIPAPMTSKDR
jgi:hypothetical protein